MTKFASLLIGMTSTALLATAVACTGGDSGSPPGPADGGGEGGGNGNEAGAVDSGGTNTDDDAGSDAAGGGSTKGSGTAHAVFTVGATSVDSTCDKVLFATYDALKFWTISCTNPKGDTVSFNGLAGSWPTVSDTTSATKFVISMGANNVGLSHTPKSFDLNVSSADEATHKIAGVATAAWDASGNEPAGSLELTFDLTFASE